MVREILAKSILNKHRKRDDWFLDDYSVNPYSGCSFNCIYCYIRGSKYGGDIEHGVSAKINAPSLLENELSKRAEKKGYGIISIGSATEPWMHIEEKYNLTRKCLHIIAKHRFPVHCLTKSPLILRDLDILKTIDENAILPKDLEHKLRNGTLITFSFSTLDEDVRKIFEPNAPRIKERLNAISKIGEHDLKIGIAFIPLLPFISDSEDQIEEMVKTAKDLDVDYIFFGDLTLHGAGRELYFKILELHFPELVEKYRSLYRNSNTDMKYKKSVYRMCTEVSKRYGMKMGIL